MAYKHKANGLEFYQLESSLRKKCAKNTGHYLLRHVLKKQNIISMRHHRLLPIIRRRQNGIQNLWKWHFLKIHEGLDDTEYLFIRINESYDDVGYESSFWENPLNMGLQREISFNTSTN